MFLYLNGTWRVIMKNNIIGGWTREIDSNLRRVASREPRFTGL
jgi:hypothetical protein